MYITLQELTRIVCSDVTIAKNNCEIDFSNEATVTLGAKFSSFRTGEITSLVES